MCIRDSNLISFSSCVLLCQRDAVHHLKDCVILIMDQYSVLFFPVGIDHIAGCGEAASGQTFDFDLIPIGKNGDTFDHGSYVNVILDHSLNGKTIHRFGGKFHFFRTHGNGGKFSQGKILLL